MITALLAVVAALCCCCCCYVAGAVDSVADSCDAIRDFVDASFCASRLRSVPGAAAADQHGHRTRHVRTHASFKDLQR